MMDVWGNLHCPCADNGSACLLGSTVPGLLDVSDTNTTGNASKRTNAEGQDGDDAFADAKLHLPDHWERNEPLIR